MLCWLKCLLVILIFTPIFIGRQYVFTPLTLETSGHKLRTPCISPFSVIALAIKKVKMGLTALIIGT